MGGSDYWSGRTAIVTGASRGLGRILSHRLLSLGARVAVAARHAEPLQAAFAAERESSRHDDLLIIPTDVTDAEACRQLVERTVEHFGRVDGLFCVAGRSDRGRIAEVDPERHRELWELNFLGTLQVALPAIPHLRERSGHLVLIGSLASRLAGPYLGAYPASKFPLTALAQQLRLEIDPRELHVLLVCPGPIRRDDAGTRYDDVTGDLPESSRRPGGGVRLSGIDPERLVDRILHACRHRRPELVVPWRVRIVMALHALAPRLAERIIRRQTTSRE